MSYPPPPHAYPQPHPVAPLTAYPYPVAPPPGYAVLVVSVNRGPYIVPAPTTSRFKIDRREVPIPGAGTWHVAVPAGPHDVRYTDFTGMPLITTTLHAHPGAVHHLSFDFGRWRNRVRDGRGVDVTSFGLWSNYTIMLVTLAVVGVLCCGGFGLVVVLTGTSS